MGVLGLYRQKPLNSVMMVTISIPMTAQITAGMLAAEMALLQYWLDSLNNAMIKTSTIMTHVRIIARLLDVGMELCLLWCLEAMRLVTMEILPLMTAVLTVILVDVVMVLLRHKEKLSKSVMMEI